MATLIQRRASATIVQGLKDRLLQVEREEKSAQATLASIPETDREALLAVRDTLQALAAKRRVLLRRLDLL